MDWREHTLAEVEVQIRDKILEKCSRDNQEARNAYALFGRPSQGITFEAFGEFLLAIGQPTFPPQAS